MKEIAHDAPARSRATTQGLGWVAATWLLFSCGGQSVETPAVTAGNGGQPIGAAGSAALGGGAPSVSGAASGGSEPATGGDPHDGGPCIMIGTGGEIGAAGSADAGAGAPSLSCDSSVLMTAIL